jgi:hypothetical protein
VQYAWIIVINIVWIVLCYNLARDKGKDTSMAIFAGLIFGIFAVIYYACSAKEDNSGSPTV